MTPHTRLPALFIPHGGGPWPWMPERRPVYARLSAFLRGLPDTLPVAPSAVLMISAHWEEAVPTLQAASRPGMFYDYGGFPAHTYEVVYPAPGCPGLVDRAQGLLQSAGLPAALDPRRGFDHGAFVPLSLLWPDADLPVVQLSLLQGLDPQAHLALGRALAPLRDEGVLIVGSGFSFHNPALRDANQRAEVSRMFDDWLQQVVVGLSGPARSAALFGWAHAPGGRAAHPREEHLLPLMVAVGAAEQAPGTCTFHDPALMGHLVVSGFALGSGAH